MVLDIISHIHSAFIFIIKFFLSNRRGQSVTSSPPEAASLSPPVL